MMNASTRHPARTLPLLYFGTAHLSLGVAAAAAACWPQAAAGFFYHSWMVAIVHLVTLGWITFSILGAIFIVGPIALRMEMPVRGADYAAFGFAATGLVGMVAHFWIAEFGGMAWSAGTVACGVLYMTTRIVTAVRRAAVQPVAFSAFPDEVVQSPLSWAEQAYPKLIYYKKHDKGGHFAAWEQPQLLSEDLRAGFRPLRK